MARQQQQRDQVLGGFNSLGHHHHHHHHHHQQQQQQGNHILQGNGAGSMNHTAAQGNRTTLQGLLKLRSKWEELFLTWGIFVVADYLFQFPLEWFVFAVYSATVIYRAFVTKATLFMIFMAIAVLADIMATLALPPEHIPLIANIVIYGYLVGAIVGLGQTSSVVWLLFCLNDAFFRKVPSSYHVLPLALYCLSVGTMMSAYALLVKVANHVHRDKDKEKEKASEKEKDKEKESVKDRIIASAEGATASSSGSPYAKSQSSGTVNESSRENPGATTTSSPKEGKHHHLTDDFADSPEIGVPEAESTAEVISRLIQSLKKEQESRKALELENKKAHQDATRLIKGLKGEIFTLKDVATHLENENKKHVENNRLLTEEKLKLGKEISRLEEQAKQLAKEAKRSETLKNRSEEILKQHLSAKPQQDLLKEEREKREKLERELENITEELAEEKRKTKKMMGDTAALGTSNKTLSKEIEETQRQLEKQARELSELREDHTEVQELRSQLAKAISELEEKNENILSLTQKVSHLQEKAKSFEATLRDETRFKMDLMSELGRSRRELEALYALNNQLQNK